MVANPGKLVSLSLKKERVKPHCWNYLTGVSITIHGYTGPKDHAINADEKLGAMMAAYRGKTGELLTCYRMETRGEPMVAWAD
jgi:hypothetical protein